MKFAIIAGLIVLQTVLRMFHIGPDVQKMKEVTKLNDDVMMTKGNHGEFKRGLMNGK
jgi:hypothetical protein